MNKNNSPEASAVAEQSIRPRLAILLWIPLAYWAALPPVGLWGLAFAVPIFWSILIRQPNGVDGSPPLKIRYIYMAAFVFWLLSIWWIACPHPLTTLGLIALAAYLSIYWPLFYATSRVAVHRWRIPVIVALPICWAGCEFLRNHLLGGFSFCSLEHALFRQTKFLQIADIGGQYLVGMMLMAVGGGIGALWPVRDFRNDPEDNVPDVRRPTVSAFVQSVLALLILLATANYGIDLHIEKGQGDLRIAALQGNIPVALPITAEFETDVFHQYLRLAGDAVAEARKKGEPLDLIVWPETVCPIKIFEFRNGGKPEDIDSTEEDVAANHANLDMLARQAGVPMLLGLSKYVFEGKPMPRYRLNSALYVDPSRDETGPRYDKVHLVMFGEYIPFSSYLSDDFFLKTICVEATPGDGPVAIPLGTGGKYHAAVNICFESTIPHLIRDQVLALQRQGTPANLLINISNDGWFRFSRQIDQHLATHVFRAIENRLPSVTATNGGFSAIIDCNGNIRKIGDRRAAQAVVGNVRIEPHAPLYHKIGDQPYFCCAVILFVLLLPGGVKRISRRLVSGS